VWGYALKLESFCEFLSESKFALPRSDRKRMLFFSFHSWTKPPDKGAERVVFPEKIQNAPAYPHNIEGS
jgi:hypothetical protein